MTATCRSGWLRLRKRSKMLSSLISFSTLRRSCARCCLQLAVAVAAGEQAHAATVSTAVRQIARISFTGQAGGSSGILGGCVK